MNYHAFFDTYKIRYQEGLSDKEFNKIEEIYEIVFPNELRNLFKQALPISNGFYNWRDFSDSNVDFILKVMKIPFDNFYKDAAEIYWNDDWGEEPNNNDETQIFIRDKLSRAPKLIPIYSHRYIPMGNANSPVFSIHGTDIIIYGETLDEYLKIEFVRKHQSSIYLSDVCNVPFWSEVL